MRKAFKTELRPTAEQAEKIRQSTGICRYLYNAYIARNQKLYFMYKRGLLDEHQSHFMSGYDFDKYVNNALKKRPGFEWIDKCGSKARKKAIMNAETAFKKFFAKQKTGPRFTQKKLKTLAMLGRKPRLSDLNGYPKFKKKKNQDVKLYFPKNNKGDWTCWRNKVQIPTIGKVSLKELGYLPCHEKITGGTVSYRAGRVLCFYYSRNGCVLSEK